MKHFFALLFITLIFAGCNKEDVDPRESLVGVYTVNYESITLLKNDQTVTQHSTATLAINKGSSSDEILITTNGSEQIVTGKSTGNTFSIPRTIVKTQYSDGRIAYGEIAEGNGSVENKTLKMKLVIWGDIGTTTQFVTGTKQ